jgi:hypothetical protein
MMNILIIKPRYSSPSQQLNAAMKSLFKKDECLSNGFSSVSDCFPENWNVKMVDMNYQILKKKHVKNADFVLMSASPDQKDSALKVFDNCQHCFSSIVVHGPVFTENIHTIDHLVVGDVKQSIDQLIHDFNAGIPEKVYTSTSSGDYVKEPNSIARENIMDMFQRKNIPAME